MMLKAVGNYMKRSSISNGNTQGEGETVMEKLKKQQSKEEGEDSPRTEDYNRADDFKVFRAANDFHENEDFVTVVQVDENERFDPRMGNWSGAHLHPSDPSKYKSTIGHTNIFPEIEAPEGMQFMGSWEVDESLGFEGWMYGTNFLDLDLGKYTKPNVRTTVRRRRWIRKVAQLPTQEEIKSVSVDRTESPVLPIQTGDDDNLPSSASPKPKSNLSSIFGETNTSDKRSASPTPSPAPASTTTPNITVSENFADNFEFDYEEDIKDNESIMSESVRLPGEGQRPQSMKLSGQPAPAKRFSWFGSSTATTSSPSTAAPPEPKQSLDPTLRVRGTTLTAIGKQIKFIEGESKKEDEVRQQRWKDVTKPQLERRIIELDKKILELKNIIERDAKDPTRGGMDNLSKLDDQLNQTTEQLDATKRELYFPFTKITLGQGGVYLAMDDFWLEYASGAFFLELCPNKKFPEINFKLFGTKQSEHNGVMARLKVEGFRLAGDKGKSVPKLKFDSLMVTIAFNFSTCLQYDFQKSKWFIDPKQFQVNILSFKGPYGLNRSIVSFVLSLLTPMIRNLLLKDLPFELGLLVRTLSSPVTMEGHFDIKGTNVRSLSLDLFKNEIFMKLCDYSPLQMEMFYWLQKALERSNVMKSAADLISYIRTYSIDGAIWRQLINLWAVATQMYCEKVALAKADQSSPGVVIKGAGFTLPQFTIHFEKFLEAADNLLSKRIGVNFTLTQIDGQVSLNHFLSFAFQIIHRVFTDAVAKATSVEKVRLMNTLEKMKISYQTSLEVLKFISKNLDFVQLTVTVDAHAGSEGIVAVTVEDILAQAPILLNLAIKEDKNIGVLPLVPYIVGMKPQENGDINLEIYHFSHDSFESPVVAAPPPTLQATPSSSSAPDPSSNGSGGSFSSSLNNSNHISSALAPPLVATQTLSSIQTGHFCTSYNKVVTNITSGKVFPRNTSSFYRREEIHKYMEIPFTTEHLEVKSEEQKRLMEEVLADMPHGDEADTVMTVSATSPHISVIVDHSITLKPGAELFTMVLGPTRPGWKPFGTSHTFDDNGNQVPEDNLDGTPRSPNGAKTFLGWPIFMQTAPGVKFLVKVPKSEVNINLPSLFRFLLAHFTDLPQLRAYLESFFGGNFFEEYLMFAKFLIDKISKYCIVPGLDLYCHLNGKLISMGGELLVRVETSDIANPGSSYNTSNSDVDPCALRLKAQISLRELVEDIHSIMHTFKLTTDAVEGNRVQQQMRDEENLADDHLPAAVNDLFLFKQAAAGVDNASNKDNAVEAMSVSGMSTSGGRNVLSQSPSSHSPLNSSMKSSSGFFGSSNNSITNNNNNNNKAIDRVSRRQSRQSD